MSKTLAVSRLHGNGSDIEERLPLVRRWFDSTGKYADRAILLVDDEALKWIQTQDSSLESHVQLVSPWTGVSSALNAGIHLAKLHGCSHMLVQSLEVRVEEKDFKRLVERVGKGVLVAGPKLASGHGKVVGLHELHADSIPWNTLAVWSVPLLSLVGFSPMSDDVAPRPGMEEVVPISLIQKIRPDDSECILMSLPGVQWEPKNDVSLVAKMSSKQSRTRLQLERLKLPARRVRVLP